MVIRASRHRYNFKLRPVPTDINDCLKPILIGHEDVRDYDINLVGLKGFFSFGAIERAEHLIIFIGENE